MLSPREGSPARRLAPQWAALAVGGLLPMVGCQAEYAGMTLPSGKYMYDDVQYFPPGPDFPWANSQAATQRARMQAQGINVENVPLPGQETAPVLGQPPAQGAVDPLQNRQGRPTDVNASPLPPEPATPPAAPAPDAGAPAPGPAVPPPPGP